MARGAYTPTAADVDVMEMRTEVESRRRPAITGGPVWAGFAIGFAVWILLELVMLSVDLTGLDFGVGDADVSSWFWNGVAAVVAFAVGGFVAGMASPSLRAGIGALNGAAVWAIGLVATVLLTGIVGGVGFGALGDVFGFEQAVRQGAGSGARISEDTADNLREAAGWAALFAALTLLGAAIAGAVGAKTWPRGNDAPSGH